MIRPFWLNLWFLSFEQFLAGSTGMFRVSVMSNGPHLLLTSIFAIVLKHPLIQLRIHSGFIDGELAGTCCGKAAWNISNLILHSWYEVLLPKCCLWFTPNVCSVTTNNFGLICPYHSSSHGLCLKWFPPCKPSMKIRLVQSPFNGSCRYFDTNCGKSHLCAMMTFWDPLRFL